MPATDSEPEKYTIDEMMDRLKSRDSSDDNGELVTRSDGTKAVRTKKRKRRTNQAVNKETKRNQRIQLLQIGGFVVVLLLLFFAAGIGILYANSSAFREKLVSKVEKTTGAEVAFYQFRMNPATANAAKIDMAWPANSPLKSLEVKSVVAKIDPFSFLGGAFSGEEIIADRGKLTLNPLTEGIALGRSLPDQKKKDFVFQRYSIPNLNVHFGAEEALLLEQTEASYFPSELAGHGEIRLSKGVLQLRDWPALELDRSFISVKNNELEVRSMRFMVPTTEDRKSVDRGTIELSGTVRPYDAGENVVLDVNLEAFRLSFLLGRDLGNFFMGRVVTIDEIGSNFMTFGPEGMVLESSITNSIDSRIDLTRFKFLPLLAITLDDRWYDLPNFSSEVSASLRREGQEVLLDEINLEQRGRMAVKGSVKAGEGGEISGMLRVGIPESMIAASKNKRLDRMFGIVREGYRWVDLTIGGTSGAPTDNFKELYDRLGQASAPSDEEVIENSVDSFDDLIEQD